MSVKENDSFLEWRIVIEYTPTLAKGATVNTEAAISEIDVTFSSIEVSIMLVRVDRNITCTLTDDLPIENNDVDGRSYVNMSTSCLHKIVLLF